MDRTTFLLAREQIRKRMENTRQEMSAIAGERKTSIIGMKDVWPVLLAIARHFALNHKATLFKTVLTTAGIRLLTSYLHRSENGKSVPSHA